MQGAHGALCAFYCPAAHATPLILLFFTRVQFRNAFNPPLLTPLLLLHVHF